MITLALAFAASLNAQVVSVSEPIDRMLSAYVAAWGRGDSNALSARYSPDGELMTPDGYRAVGKRAIAAFYRAAFLRGYAGSRAVASLSDLKPLSDRMLLGRGHWRIDGAKRMGAARPSECGEFAIVVRGTKSGWRIAALHEFNGACEAQGNG
jgi:uncharacterized protein (TIGR02246 family)